MALKWLFALVGLELLQGEAGLYLLPTKVAFLLERESRFEVTFDQSASELLFRPPPQWGGLDLNSSNRGCARLGGEVDPPLGVVVEEVAVLIVLVRRHRRAVRAAVRRAVDDEVPGAIEEETAQPRCAVCPQALCFSLKNRCIMMIR